MVAQQATAALWVDPRARQERLATRWKAATRRGADGPMADAMCRQMVLASPVFMAQALLRGPGRAPFHGRYLYSRWHLKVDRIITSHHRFAIMAPRGIGKSELCSFAYPIWQMIRNRLPDGMLLSSTKDNAKVVLEKIRNEIETNPKLQWLYPTNKPGRKWNTDQITCSNGHTILSRSVGTKIRGRHPGWVLGDDILTDEAKWSEVYRRKVADWWLGTVEPLPTHDGQLGVIGTPMNKGDLIYKDLAEIEEYSHHSFPILDPQGRSLWPSLFPPAYVQRRRNIMGPHRFSTEMMLEPVSDETSMLPKSLLMGPPQEQMTFALGMSAQALAPMGLSFYMGVDLAFSTGAGGDYFVCMVLGVDAHENRWIVAMERRKGVPYHEQLSIINRLGKTYDCQRIYVEANQAQRIIGDELLRLTSLPIRKFTMTANKHDLESGFPSLRRLAESQKFRLPRGDKASVDATDILIDELSSFTFLRGRVTSVGAHDDTVAALYIAEQAAKAGSGFHFGASARVAGPKPLPGIASEPARRSPQPAVISPVGLPGAAPGGLAAPEPRRHAGDEASLPRLRRP